ncbi:MAG: hypothetical protein JW818_14795 [Pirellulales bacterium]|nr:hypothetical protein [Pirellulales bacterium]
MCFGLALPIDAVPEEWVERYPHRVATREPEATRELRFTFRDPQAELPVWHGHRLELVAWGNRDDRASRLPRTGWCRQESLEAGRWTWLEPEMVEIPAALGLEKGVWFLITEGIRGVLVRDEHARPRVYMLTQPASRYYQIMTRHDRMPVLLGQQI